jgi:hypothetical protein
MTSDPTQPVAPLVWSSIDHDNPDPSGPTIRTVSGLYLNLLDPSPASIEFVDIAVALTSTCRFGGHTRTFYSVAEHSLAVASMLHRQTGDPELALAGLLHDAAEAYIGDMVRPLKRSGRLDEFAVIEANLARAIEVRFDLDPGALDDPRVHQCDQDILPWEMAMFRDLGYRKSPDFPMVLQEFTMQGQLLMRRAAKARHDRECDECGGAK